MTKGCIHKTKNIYLKREQNIELSDWYNIIFNT